MNMLNKNNRVTVVERIFSLFQGHHKAHGRIVRKCATASGPQKALRRLKVPGCFELEFDEG
jgi:hypothetical protein